MAELPEPLRAALEAALRRGDEEEAEGLARRALEQGVDPLAVIQQVVVPTLTDIGRLFQEFEIFLPELMMAGEAGKRVATVVEQAALAAGRASEPLATVVLGTVQGDMHDIGRNIVGTLLTSHGFRVLNLGRDVAPSAFVEAAHKEGADIVGLSALMTTTLPAQRRTIRLFEEIGVRQRYRIIVGGGAASQAWAQEIGADGYAPDAASATTLCKSLLGLL